MYFRRKTTPSGKVLQLVESYRTEQGLPRQRVIISLGNAQIPDSIRQVVAARVQDHIQGQANLFSCGSDDDEVRYWADYVVRRIAARPPATGDVVSEGCVDGVLLDQVQHESVSELGPELVALEAWRCLGFDDCLAHLGFNELQRKTAAATVINRLVASVSDHRLEQWVPQTALPELLGEKLLGQGDDPLLPGERQVVVSSENYRRAYPCTPKLALLA
jgi:hypothetical protein